MDRDAHGAPGLTFSRVIDISTPLGDGAPDYPGDPPFQRRELASLAAGAPFTLSALSMSAHSGTHLDAPAHFLERGETIDAVPPERFISPAIVVDAAGEDVVTASVFRDVQNAFRPGDAVLFRTDNSLTGRGRNGVFEEDYVALSQGAAKRLVDMGAGLAGLDALTVDAWGDEACPVHHILLGAGIFILEGLDLSAAAPGRYTLVCPPLFLRGCEASPVRAVLLA